MMCKRQGQWCIGKSGTELEFIYKNIVTHIDGFFHGRGGDGKCLDHKKPEHKCCNCSNDKGIQYVNDKLSFFSLSEPFFPEGPVYKLRDLHISQYQQSEEQPEILHPDYKQCIQYG